MRPLQARHLCARSLAMSLGMVWLASAAVALAQPPLTLPQPSQAASAGQRVGLTDITVTYHRPAVNKREIWGKLVPYGQVWRAGANENTVITFSTPVSIGGHALPAGSYGLHMIPAEREWTVIFNRESKAWGSFFYDQADDAARVTVTPSAAPFEEHLAYTFDDVTDKSAVATLHWEKLAVPIRIDVDTSAVVVASLHSELRGLQGFSSQRLAQAAEWCATNNVNLDEAGKWADQAVAQQENFQTLRAKAAVAERKGDVAAASCARSTCSAPTWRSPTSRQATRSSSVRTTTPHGARSWIGRKCRSVTRMGSLRSPRRATAATSSGWSIRGTAGCRHSPCSPCLQASCVSAAGPADTPAGHRGPSSRASRVSR